MRLRLENLSVEFGATRALDGVTLSVAAGEVVGLLGHNGAGKSTLFNVLSGVYAASSGDFTVDGVPAPGKLTPQEAAGMGITVIHQEPALAPNLSILDNLFLGQGLRPSVGQREQARRALAEVGSDLDPGLMVDTLSLGERQLVDLARGFLAGGMKMLLLDEPTAALGRAETESLHALIRQLAARGVTVIYVSHRLPDILDVCERILVLRSGCLVVDGTAESFTGRTLAQALAPGMGDDKFVPARVQTSAGLLRSDGVSVAAGEVVGLFGMAAGEQFSFLAGLFGLDGHGRFSWNDRDVDIASPGAAVRWGIHLVPADRENDGLVSGASALDTVFLPWFSQLPGRGWWVGPAVGENTYAEARKKLNILGPGSDAPIDEFSGGNRQKHLLSRWMFPRQPRVLLLAQPTQGVDVGAKQDIATAVRELAAQGVAVLVASAESDEIAQLCDRSYVMYGGSRAEVPRGPEFSGDLVSTLLHLSDAERPMEGVSR
ncbi:sugar ABC transporter ATP-binding protein [Paeniglutamicibacter sp. ABSL32-1]|uniref:sugar ABC transporter ATP-binding protein n=1 Tax=Paeniglutamicibacter quisquiliarum TaxID=2849498 RepID=UPI001C2DA660|nr:sugar ABC transporter ATP-binding protein [Paeniglutamicibacter quisquiliarum]MBV1780083.1 sugar ABC transporter ATP-binding protein [Paeniglutamicibacter quisquiliarum]